MDLDWIENPKKSVRAGLRNLGARAKKIWGP